MRERRRQIPCAERDRYSAAVCAELLRRFAPVKLVCCYDAFPDEIDLAPFIDACGGEVVFPEKRGKEYFVDRAGEVDLWICPGLAFTKDGKRIGFGGGWYDRFLAGAKGWKVGVAYPWQLVETLPQEPTDIRLDEVVYV